jgi:cell division protein ZapE
VFISGTRNDFFSPLNAEAKDQIQDAYKRYCGHAEQKALRLEINGRVLFISDACLEKKACLLNFSELCRQVASTLEYLALVQNFKTLFLTDIPQFNASNRDDARRFIILIDILYEHRVRHSCHFIL